jgi:hypothetical protein
MRAHRYFTSFILMAAMVGPLTLGAAPLNAARDHDDNDHRVHRYYDRTHRDFHEWNEHESLAYRRWEAANHRRHREFVRRQRIEQDRYWSWRHSHPDHD